MWFPGYLPLYKSEVPKTPFVGTISFYHSYTSGGKNILTNLVKGCDSATAWWKQSIGQGGDRWGGAELTCYSLPALGTAKVVAVSQPVPNINGC